MNSFLRFFGLSLFGAAGVALAVWLATSVPQPPVARGHVVEPSSDPATPEAPTVQAPPAAPAPVAAQTEPESHPASAPAIQQPLAQPISDSRPLPLVVRPIAMENDSETWPIAPRPTISQMTTSKPDAIDPASIGELLQQLPDAVNQLPPSPRPTPPAPADVELPAPSRLDEPSDERPAAPAPPSGSGRQQRTEIKSTGPGDRNLTIHIQDTDIREVLDMISEQGGLNILASRNVQGKVSASLTNVDIDTALAAILKSTGYIARHEGKFIYVGNPQDFHSMEQAGDKIGTRVYRPNYVKAADLQALIVPLLTPQIGTASVTKPAQVGIGADSAEVGGDAYAGTDALLVHDYEAVLLEVDQVFEEIDKRPTQVSIEAMILSVKLDDANSFGVDFQFLRNKPNIAFATGSPVSDLGQVSFTDGGLKFGFLDSSLGAFVNALETIGDTNVIATPRLMCLNKHRAEILIGSKLGYITKTLTQTTTAETVDFMEVGTQLRIRPFISSDGLIRMEVHPELSTGQVQIQDGLTIPDKQVTEVTTNVMVRDGCTVIIGGLMQETLGETTNQVPLLGGLPGIGWLFRSKLETTDRAEIIILITPHIVYEPDTCAEGQHESCAYHDRQAVYADHMSPIGTRYLGRKYLRLAEGAWANGNRREALRLVNVSIGFDPTSRAAIDLRHAICNGVHGTGNPGTGNPGPGSLALGPTLAAEPMAPSPDALDGKAISPWVLEHLNSPGPSLSGPNGHRPETGMPLHPWDPGQPGNVRRIERPGSSMP